MNPKCKDCDFESRFVFQDLLDGQTEYYCSLHYAIRCIKVADHPNIRKMVAQALGERN